MSKQHFEVVIIGGGSAGISLAAHLQRHTETPQMAIIDPADVHYYQPIWTLVGAGVVDKESSAKPMADVIPDGVTWIQDRVATFDPDGNTVTLGSGEEVGYDQLVVAPGIQVDWKRIKGLRKALGKGGVCSNYSYDHVDSTWEAIRSVKGGNALFTYPKATIKCGGAPQKIMWLAEEAFRRQGVRHDTEVHYLVPSGGIFGIPRYAKPLRKLADERGVILHTHRDLIEVRSKTKEAVFRSLNGGEELVLPYSMIHVTPPQSAPDFVAKSALSNEAGWVDVDKHTMQHVKYDNVFSLGDASSLPCSKTGAAVRKQAPILAANIVSFRAGKPLTEKYNGYASCPLVTGYGKLILAEFGYDGEIMETFPFPQDRERYSMYALKAYALPSAYWHGMLRGRL